MMCLLRSPTLPGGKEAIYRYMSVSRQSHHQWVRRQRNRQSWYARLLAAIRRIYAQAASLGCRKVLSVLHREYGDQMRIPGRDVIAWLRRRHGLLPRYPRRFRKRSRSQELRERYPNRIKDRPAMAAGHVMVSDMTFVRTRTGLVPVLQVMDLASRYVLAVQRMPNETAASFLTVLEQARRRLPRGASIIHHSDGGSQYRSDAMATWARTHGIRLSTAWTVYENSTLERVNHTMKYEHALSGVIDSPAVVDRLLSSYQTVYNTFRPHWALDLRTPHEVFHAQCLAQAIRRKVRRHRRGSTSRSEGASGGASAGATRRSLVQRITAMIDRVRDAHVPRIELAISL